MRGRITVLSLAAIAVATMVACNNDQTPVSPLKKQIVATQGVYMAPDLEQIEVCKFYDMKTGATPPDSTSFTLVGSNGITLNNFKVKSGTCRETPYLGGSAVAVTITENVPAGFTPSYMQTTIIGPLPGTIQGPIGPIASNVAHGFIGGAIGELFVFTNTEIVTTPGCTYTLGYWKTHSSKGPAPYDNRWLNIGASGEDTQFFSTGKSWYTVFNTAPKKGNANYILAHQYMAAKLNILAGASTTPEVDAAMQGAAAYFQGVSNMDTAPVDPTRSQLVTWSDLLDNYNNGLIGPGHC
ncbi:MAG: hypothetical protein U0132_19700 [Gemmatimonadaceae bacterium]